jgi:beta-N-acetylhexosaminidase
MKRKKKSGKVTQEHLFLFLLTVVLFLASLNVAQARGLFIPDQEPIFVENGVINLNGLTIDQKISQMLIVQAEPTYVDIWSKMHLGGVHLFARQTEELFIKDINSFQNSVDIPYFVSVDLEGCLSPFGHLREFVSVSDITTQTEAFEKGVNDGAYLKKLGFNLNFAPVVDLEDSIWKCRSFQGDEKRIGELATSYVKGLQSHNVIATAKHYPGKTLVVKDPHKFLVAATIGEEDIYPYQFMNDEVQAIMVSHVISTGAVDSNGVPAVVSKPVFDQLREEYTGLLISDEIHMLGLKTFFDTVDEMYIAVFNAGNDVVLNFDRDPNEVYRMIKVVAKAVEEGKISEDQIDDSLRRIFKAKGFVVQG